MKTFRIVAPHFVAGCSKNRCAPIIHYMQDWPISKIQSYCNSKGWKLEIDTSNSTRELNTPESSLTNKGANMNGIGNQDYSNIFRGIANAKSMGGGGYAERLGLGSHKVAIKSFKVKESTKNGNTQFLEAEFVILESNTHRAGETRGWAWFINSQGWSGAYEQDRAKKFLEAVGACVGDDSPVEVIGANLAGANQAGKGLILEVTVSPQAGKNAGKTNAKGEPYTNIYWRPVPQSMDDLGRQRQEIESLEAAQVPVETPVQTSTTQAAAPRGLGLLGRK